MNTYIFLSLLSSIAGVVMTTIGYLKAPTPYAGGAMAFSVCLFITIVAMFVASIMRHS